MWQEIKRLIEERGQKIAGMKAMLKKANDEKRSLTPEEDAAFNTLNTEAEELKTRSERMQKVYDQERDLEQRANAAGEGTDASAGGGNGRGGSAIGGQDDQQRSLPGRGRLQATNPAGEGDDELRSLGEEERRHEEVRRQMVTRFFSGEPMDFSTEELRKLPPDLRMELRAVTKGSTVVGDRQFRKQLVDRMKYYAGVREAGAEIMTTETGNEFTIPTGDDTANEGQVVDESTEDNAEADPTFGTKTLKAHTFDSKWIKVSLVMLQDAEFAPRVENYVLRKASERIGRHLNVKTTTGTGTDEPEGIVTASTVGKTAALTNAVTYDELIDFDHTVDKAYRNDPTYRWMMHDLTLAALRKLKDGDGRYIWTAGTSGVPGKLMDRDYTVNNDMAHIGSGPASDIIVAGAFGYYVVRDVADPYIVRADQLFIGQRLIGFRVFSRHDGKLTESAAIRKLRLAA